MNPVPPVDLDREFNQDPALIYLNHAAVAPIPRRAARAGQEFLERCALRGAADYPEWMATVDALRGSLAELINAPRAEDVALVKNTSEGLSIVAHGFPWSRGENVVLAAEEFPSNRVVWESLTEYGVTARTVDLSSAVDPEQALLDACDEHTRMLAISAVQFASGLRLDLQRLGEECRARGLAFCVDAIQAVGAIPQDVQSMNIDFLAADAHKWMLGPEGIGLFYCSSRWRERLRLRQFGWHMRENDWDYDSSEWQPAHSARRFECGSLNVLGIHVMAASVDLLLGVGITAIEQKIATLTSGLFDLIGSRDDLEAVTRSDPIRVAGIVTFRSRTRPAEEIYRLLRSRGVICAKRGGGIRFSPHFYIRPEQLSQAIDLIPA